MLLLQLDYSKLFVEMIPFLVNWAGWALFGFVLGFVFRERTRNATPTI